MARQFAALDGALDDAIELPLGDRLVRIEGPSAEDGLRVEKIMALAAQMHAGGQAPDAEVLDDVAEVDLYRAVLGAQYDDLKATLSWPQFKHVCMTVVFWVTAGMETAEKYWASGGDPNRVAQNRATRRAGTPSSGTAAASATRRRASTSGTSTRKVKPRVAQS